MDRAYSINGWHTGAALSFKHIASYYSMRGGSSGRDDLCGVFYIRSKNIYSATSWDFCAALSFILHIMLNVVVVHLLVMGVVYFI